MCSRCSTRRLEAPTRSLELLIVCLLMITGGGCAQDAPPQARAEFGEVLSSGDGPLALVLVPCLGCDARSWDEFMERNQERYRMFAVTWPGLGATDLPDVSSSDSNTPLWDSLFESMDVLIEREALNDVVLVGHSAAGPYVVQYAARRPEKIKAVVSVDATITNWDTFGYSREQRIEWAEREFADVLVRYDSDQAWAELNAPPSLPNPERSAFYGDMWLRPPRSHVLAYWREWLMANSGVLIGDFPRPLLSLFAIRPTDDDPESTKRERLARYQRAGAPSTVRVQFVEDAGHTIWEWQPEAFDRAIAGFVAGLE